MSNPEKLVILASYNVIAEAHLDMERLLDAGIYATVFDTNLVSLYGFGFTGVTLRVFDTDVNEAKALLGM